MGEARSGGLPPGELLAGAQAIAAAKVINPTQNTVRCFIS
jgi:hypothetical protein